MMKVLDISVVMSVYNGAEHLRESVDSILSQEDVDFELIIIDDGSTDKSREILDEYAKRESRVRVIHQENTGLTRALIRGCNEARGEFIARQDSDDISLPGRLKKLLELIEANPKLAFVSSWTEYIGPEGELLFQIERPVDPAVAIRQLLFEKIGPPAHGSVMFRKKAYGRVGGYREAFYYGQDSDLWLRMGLSGLIAYVPEYLYRYRYSPKSISGSKRNVQKEFGRIGQECHKARLQGKPEDTFLEAASNLRKGVLSIDCGMLSASGQRASSNYFIGSGLYSRGDGRAKRYFWKAIKADPFHWRAWLKLVSSVAKDPPFFRNNGKK